MKKVLLSFLLSVSLLSGCQTFNELSDGVSQYVANGHKSLYDNIVNKDIRNAFLIPLTTDKGLFNYSLAKPLVAAKFKIHKINTGMLVIEHFTSAYGETQDALKAIRIRQYNAAADLPAKYFVDQARAHGNTVIVYKAAISGSINAGLWQPPIEFKGSFANYGNEPVFVEFDKTGSPIAIMTRTWQTHENIGTGNTLYTNIYFARDALTWFQNNFSNSYLDNYTMKIYR